MTDASFRNPHDNSCSPGVRAREEAAAPPKGALSFVRWLLIPLFLLSIFAMAVESAEAKRFGGGRSFGSKPSQSSGYKKPAPSKDADGGQQSPSQKSATGAGSAPRTGGFGGMLGGMLMGGLIGSMLFGGGFGGGIGFLELLLLGFAGYMLIRFIRSRKVATANGAGADGRYAYAGAGNAGSAPSGGGGLFGQSSAGREELRQTPPPQGAAAYGIDEGEFLEGAKMLYVRLQNSWDKRDLEDIRSFASPEVMSEIEKQASEEPDQGRTDVLMVEARILEVKREGSETLVTVFYDALLREEQSAQQPEQVREVWHYRRDESSDNPEWILEGIQQLEM